MLKIKNPRFVKSIMNWQDAPSPPMPEIAFAGRSNVGKSSLINCLVNIKNFARVSKQPGKTRTINFFNIDNRFYLVDLPGYGFAKVGKKAQRAWQESIENYLQHSPHLIHLFVLIDCRVGAKESDRQLAEWLAHLGIPFTLIATKADKISRGAWPRQGKLIRQALRFPPETPLIFFSAVNRTGRDEVLGKIQRLLEK